MTSLLVASVQHGICSRNFVWRLVGYVRHACRSRMVESGPATRQGRHRFPAEGVHKPAGVRVYEDDQPDVLPGVLARCTGAAAADPAHGLTVGNKDPLQVRYDVKPRHRPAIVPACFRIPGGNPTGMRMTGAISLHAGWSAHGCAIPCAARRPRRRITACVVLLCLAMVTPGAACASDWGCQVILCLSNPGGPEQYSECVPPVEKLWSALRHGDPFPTCDFGASGSQGTSAANTFANAGYCREDFLFWGGPEQSELLCRASGAINVDINGQLYTRVWWDVGGPGATLTEFYGAGSTQAQYDPTQSATLFLQQTEQGSGPGGGN